MEPEAPPPSAERKHRCRSKGLANDVDLDHEAPSFGFEVKRKKKSGVASVETADAEEDAPDAEAAAVDSARRRQKNNMKAAPEAEAAEPDSIERRPKEKKKKEKKEAAAEDHVELEPEVPPQSSERKRGKKNCGARAELADADEAAPEAEAAEPDSTERRPKEKKKKEKKEAAAEDHVELEPEVPPQSSERKRRKKNCGARAELADADEAAPEAEAPEPASTERRSNEKEKPRNPAAAEEHLEFVREAPAQCHEKRSRKTIGSSGAELAYAEEAAPAAVAPEPDRVERVPKEKNSTKRAKGLTEDDEALEPVAGTADVGYGERASFKVYVGGLPFSTIAATLRDDFSKCGEISELALLSDKNGKSRGIAFITFASKRGLKAALKWDGEEYHSRVLKVSKAEGSGERQITEGSKAKAQVKGKGKAATPGLELFVGGLPYVVEEQQVRELFEKCGELSRFDMPFNRRGKRKGTSTGVAWVAFKKPDGMRKALELGGTDFCGRKLVVEKRGAAESEGPGVGKGKGKGFGKNKGKDQGKGKSLVPDRAFEVFVGGLPYSASEESVRRDFEECGEILRFAMPLDEDGQSKGIAFVNYRDEYGMQKAMEFNETEYGGVTIRVQKAAAPRSARLRDTTAGPTRGEKGSGREDAQGAPASGSKGEAASGVAAFVGKKMAFSDSEEE